VRTYDSGARAARQTAARADGGRACTGAARWGYSKRVLIQGYSRCTQTVLRTSHRHARGTISDACDSLCRTQRGIHGSVPHPSVGSVSYGAVEYVQGSYRVLPAYYPQGIAGHSQGTPHCYSRGTPQCYSRGTPGYNSQGTRRVLHSATLRVLTRYSKNHSQGTHTGPRGLGAER
jgi:hypothetical protein